MTTDRPSEEQLDGLADMSPAEFRASAHEVVDLIADYLESVGERAVLPAVEPGSIAPLFPQAPPEEPAPIAAILDDYRRLVEPGATHWQHPGFFAYFPTTASGAGILGEMLTAGLGQNPMLWRTSPIGTELEGVVVGWLRDALGLPASFDGLITDTASTSSLIALAAAREVATGAAARGLAARDDIGAPRVYASTEAHSSIDKACMTLGIGRDAVVHVAANERFEMRADVLDAPSPPTARRGISRSRSSRPSARPRPPRSIRSPPSPTSPSARACGCTSTPRMPARSRSFPQRRGPFAGWERADSIVVNPHKWLFVPLDASLLLTRRMERVHDTFSLRPEYLRTLDRAGSVRDYAEYTPQLGRRFRALKLWMHLRWFGVAGLRRRIERHLEMAQAFADAVDAEADWERLAPVPFSTVCFRWRPRDVAATADEPETSARLDTANAAIMDGVNRSGEAFLSHTRLGDRFTIRLAIGNLRTEPRHVERTWALLQEQAALAAAAQGFTMSGNDASYTSR